MKILLPFLMTGSLCINLAYSSDPLSRAWENHNETAGTRIVLGIQSDVVRKHTCERDALERAQQTGGSEYAATLAEQYRRIDEIKRERRGLN